MSTWDLLVNQTGTQSAPPPVLPVEPWGPTNPKSPTQQQTFQLTITCDAGNCSGSAQPLASNDGVNWVNYGDALTTNSAYLSSTAAATLNGAFRYFGAYLVSISGTNAKANMKMSA